MERCTSKNFFLVLKSNFSGSGFRSAGGPQASMTPGLCILGCDEAGDCFLIGGRLLGGVFVELAGTEPCFAACFGLFGIGVGLLAAPGLFAAPPLFEAPAAARAAAAAHSLGMVMHLSQQKLPRG